MIVLCCTLILALIIPLLQEAMGYAPKEIETVAKENSEVDFGMLSMLISLFLAVVYGIYKQYRK